MTTLLWCPPEDLVSTWHRRGPCVDAALARVCGETGQGVRRRSIRSWRPWVRRRASAHTRVCVCCGCVCVVAQWVAAQPAGVGGVGGCLRRVWCYPHRGHSDDGLPLRLSRRTQQAHSLPTPATPRPPFSLSPPHHHQHAERHFGEDTDDVILQPQARPTSGARRSSAHRARAARVDSDSDSDAMSSGGSEIDDAAPRGARAAAGGEHTMPRPDADGALADVDVEEQRMLLAAMTGEPYDGDVAAVERLRWPTQDLSPAGAERAALRHEQDAAYHASLEVWHGEDVCIGVMLPGGGGGRGRGGRGREEGGARSRMRSGVR